MEKLQARLNGRDPGELLDTIEAEGFEPEGWNFEVGAVIVIPLLRPMGALKLSLTFPKRNCVSQRWLNQGELGRRRTMGSMRKKR